jgi:hypothetical protein
MAAICVTPQSTPCVFRDSDQTTGFDAQAWGYREEDLLQWLPKEASAIRDSIALDLWKAAQGCTIEKCEAVRTPPAFGVHDAPA